MLTVHLCFSRTVFLSDCPVSKQSFFTQRLQLGEHERPSAAAKTHSSASGYNEIIFVPDNWIDHCHHHSQNS
jgi:hypothetical protein